MKKHKKLIAILMTLAFVMSLMPMAFAADYPKTIGASASYVIQDRDSAPTSSATNRSPIKFTLMTRESDGTSIRNNVSGDVYYTSDVFFKVDSDAVQIAVPKANVFGTITDADVAVTGTGTARIDGKNASDFWFLGSDRLTKDGASLELVPDANGRVEFYTFSNVAVGEATVTLRNADDDSNPLTIDSKKVRFTATATSINDVALTVKMGSGSTLPATDAATMAAGGEVKLEATVTDANGNGIANQSVEFFRRTSDSGSYVRIATVNTNNIGVAEYKYNETKAGDYRFYARVGDNYSYTAIGDLADKTVETASPVKLEARKATDTVAVNKGDINVEFNAYDFFGNPIKLDASLFEVKFTDTPSDSGYAKNDTLTIFEAAGTGLFAGSDNDRIRVSFEPDVVGEYKVEASIVGMGVKAETIVNAKEFGTVTAVKVSLATNRVGLRTLDLLPTDSRTADSTANSRMNMSVKVVDENGVEINANTSDVRLNSSNVGLALVDGFTIYGPINNTRGVATITATHVNTGLQASVDVPVVGGPAAITADVTNVTDGVATVSVALVDSNGTRTFAGSTMDYNVIGAGVTTLDQNVIHATRGNATFKVAAEGTKTITVVTTTGLATSFTVDFDKATGVVPVKPVYGAAEVTMLIGAGSFVADGAVQTSDLAPFIRDGRTFVPFRVLAEAFGAEVDWTPKDAAVEVVTLTREDVSMTITIGSNDIVVVKDGETNVVTADVAAFIEEGRTVLPFRAVAEAFGAEVTFGPEDGPVEWVKFQQ